MLKRLQRIVELLSDPRRSRGVLRRLENDAEARSEIERAITGISAGEDPEAILRTGGALGTSVWARILDAADAELLPPDTPLGRYRIQDHVGSGGMGAVYAAYDPELDRRIAIKVLHAADPTEQQRLLREARALAQLDHPSIVGVHDVGTIDGRVFITMEFIDGQHLRDWAAGRPWREVLAACLEAGRGLAAAHLAGLVHRDFKPDNVLVDEDDRVRIVDFGLSRPTADHPGPTRRPVDETALAEPQVTQQGAFVGTPAYMAPEQFLEGRFDENSDQFAFAVTTWEVLYGERPYRARETAALQRIFEAGTGPQDPGASPVPQRIQSLLERALSVDPATRFPSLAPLLDALADRPRRRARQRAAWIIPTAAALGAVLWIGMRDPAAVCADATAQLAGIWDDAQTRTLQDVFEQSGHPRSAGIFDRTRNLLDRYAADWANMRTEACEATSVRGEQSPALMDLRMSCMDRRRSEFVALVKSLAGSSATDLDHAIDSVLRLEPLAICADTPLLTAPSPRPTEPDRLALLEGLERRMSALKAVRDTADPAVLSQDAESLARDADQFGYAPLVAESWYLVGLMQDLVGQFDAAEDSLFRAWVAARRGNHDEYLIHTLNRLVWLDGNDRGRTATAERWRQLAWAELERADPGPSLLAEYYNNWGAALQVAGRLDEALVAHREALRLHERLFGRDSYPAAKSFNNLGSVQFTAGRFSAALKLYERALAISRRELGVHTFVAVTLGNVGAARVELGDYAGGREMGAEALQMNRDLFGEASPWVAVSLLNLGFARIADQPGEALEYMDRGAELLATALPADHPYQAFPVSGRGRTLVALGRWAEAVPVMRDAIGTWEASGVASPYDLAGDRFTLAQALWESHGDRNEARILAQQALEALRAMPAEQLPLRGQIAAWLEERAD